jgi:hypothetical protein
MEADKLFRGAKPQESLFALAGKFGRGVSLSHQDRAEESKAAFLDAVNSVPKAVRPLVDPKNPRLPVAALQSFFFRHPDLSRAVAEAVARNKENGVKDTSFDWLMRPGSLVGGPKG